MRELPVVLESPVHLEALQEEFTVVSFSKLANVAVVLAPEEEISRIKELPGVVSVEPAKVGSFQV